LLSWQNALPANNKRKGSKNFFIKIVLELIISFHWILDSIMIHS
jgi:hypothetical protein